MLPDIGSFFHSLFHMPFWVLGRNPADPKKNYAVNRGFDGRFTPEILIFCHNNFSELGGW